LRKLLGRPLLGRSIFCIFARGENWHFDRHQAAGRADAPAAVRLVSITLKINNKSASNLDPGIENSLAPGWSGFAGTKEAPMHQIVYTSTAVEDFSPADIERLLLDARRRNRALGVSGMLVFHDRTFLQALEGEQRAVNEIFARIASDRRHHDIEILHRGSSLDQRLFGDGSMGFADFTGAADLLKAFVRLNERMRIKELDGPRAMELLATAGAEDEVRSADAC
jgi:FAD-dependent sensor of blue light